MILRFKLIFLGVLFFNMFLLSSCDTDEPIPNLDVDDYLNNSSGFDDSDDENSGLCSILLSDCESYDSVNDRIWYYNVILPPGYSEENEYPVLYLLHGRWLGHGFWVDKLEICETIDPYYKNNLFDVIVVMPEGWDTYYLDDYHSGIKYESYFWNDFVPLIENNYPIKKDYNSRYIGGISMGGYGAAYYTFKYGMFSFCYSASSPFDGNGNPLSPPVYDFIDLETDEFPNFIIDIGMEDFLREVNIDANLILASFGIPHEFIIRKGGHDAVFWKGSLQILFDRLSSFIAQNKD